MGKSKYVLISICIVCLVLFVFNYIFRPTVTISKETAVVSSKLIAVTMKEAIAIAYEDVKQLPKDAKLVMIISADAKNNQRSDSGESGKRVIWNLIFSDPKSTDGIDGGTPTSYNIQISDGKIADCKSTKFGNHTKIEDSDVTLDSSDAVAIAKNRKALKPGKDWAIGYHFVMEYFPIGEEEKTERLIIEVVGQSPKGNFAHVDIDEKTGEIVDAIEKTYDDKGNAIWTNF